MNKKGLINMNFKKRKKVETSVGEAMTRFFKEQMGEQTQKAVVKMIDDAIIVRFKEILPPSERLLMKNKEGMELIKELKEKLIKRAKPILEVMIQNIIGGEVLDIHSSFNPVSGEHIEIFILDTNEKCIKKEKKHA